MPPLHDPDKPAHYIVETYQDRSALRNDGIELPPTITNKWYVMMTAAELPYPFYDEEILKANRRIWNGWACGSLSPEERAEIETLLDVSAEELAPLTMQEQEILTQALRTRLKDNTVTIPNQVEVINFSNTYFSEPFNIAEFYIPTSVKFDGAVFNHKATFDKTAFTNRADFNGTMFNNQANFKKTKFTDVANFEGAILNHGAEFIEAVFHGHAKFKEVVFKDMAKFNSVEFQQLAFFNQVVFKRDADFSDSKFLSTSYFTKARFETHVPEFYDTQFHENIAFTTDDQYWPKITKGEIAKALAAENTTFKDRAHKGQIIQERAAESKRAYIRLRQQMNQLQKHDDEHFFYRQEMDCKALLEGRTFWLMTFLFKGLSNYGYSVVRPLSALIVLILLCGVAYWLIWVDIDSSGPYYPRNFAGALGALGQSISTSFPFFGFQKLYYAADFYRAQPAWLRGLSGFQTVISFMLIFLLGLGLRNRFRLK